MLQLLDFEPGILASYGCTQQFQGLDTVGPHVTESGNNMQSNILTSTKNLIQELHKHLRLSISTNEVVSHWLLLLLTQTTEHEK